MSRILVVTDNEGCLTPGKGRAFNLAGASALLALLTENRRIELTIATGRPASYVEALTQAFGCRIQEPIVCEGGAVIYYPLADHTELLAEPVAYSALKPFLGGLDYRLEVGKQVCVSFYPENDTSIDAIADRLRSHGVDEKYNVTTSSAAVDVTPRGVDKKSGLAALRARLSGSYSQIAAFGDGENDLPLLEACKLRGCPINAKPSVKDICTFRSSREDIEGLLDFLQSLIEEASVQSPKSP